MSEQFVKGYTNNHLTWAMVDATDFATPESALSAATKIKIWGKLKGATGVNFVSSGTGSTAGPGRSESGFPRRVGGASLRH